MLSSPVQPRTTIDSDREHHTQHPHLPDSRFSRVRQDSLDLCQPLELEDYGIQTMPDVSPPKWHLAHTSWFFETFLLKPFLKAYREYHPSYENLFNSYYNSIGEYHPRPQRGLLSRPVLKDILAYRTHVNEHMLSLLDRQDNPHRPEILERTLLGIHHEQQHQELLLTDIKHIFASNPLRPVYQPQSYPVRTTDEHSWLGFEGGVIHIGHNAEIHCPEQGADFCYDNELPRHRAYINDFQLGSRLVTNAEIVNFIKDRGYDNPALWLSDGWSTVKAEQWQAPLYWEQRDGEWWHMTLAGMQVVDLNAPACHLSFYEADAFARWSDSRLPTETEWEFVAAQHAISGNLRDSGYFQPVAAERKPGITQLFGDVWEWTQSPYSAYPGYRAANGALGEYNGKFMSNQIVLRGGSCVTPADHVRASYRNFFYPADRWQFTGLRLARDVT